VCGEDWLRSPGSVKSVVVALGNDISRRSGAVSSLIVDSGKVNFSYIVVGGFDSGRIN
jgi:hypothetical protein